MIYYIMQCLVYANNIDVRCITVQKVYLLSYNTNGGGKSNFSLYLLSEKEYYFI